MKAQYLRCKHRISNLETGEIQTFESINAAKRASRELQGNKLGQGLVKVVTKL